MCGITGIFRFKGQTNDADKMAIRKMTEALSHRGPDDEGYYLHQNVLFGHKRLSIIDLNSGHQPMSNEDGSVWIILNGEIYNYVELRDELMSHGAIFKTHSDTEVVLKLYEREGKTCVDCLNGMFAFAIWDGSKLTLFRDRLGIKPLYYYFDDEKFAFASEIKAFVAGNIIKAELNRKVLEDYVALQLGLSDETFFKRVKKLLPGCIVSMSQKKQPEVQTYWKQDFTVCESEDHDESEYVERLTDLLKDAVRLQIRSDVPIGSHLSGGLDSSAVCCLASKALGKNLKTFTGYFTEGGMYDESSFARTVNDYLKADGFFQEVAYKDAAESLEKLIFMMDEPQAGPGIIPQYSVSKAARQHVKVVLSGLGGDEIFGGYARYYLAYFEECLKGAVTGTQSQQDRKYVVSFESLLPNLAFLNDYMPLMKSFWSHGLFEGAEMRYFDLMRRDGGNGFFTNDVYNDKIVGDVRGRFKTVFESTGAKSLLNKMLGFDLKIFIPALLQVEDRTSMAASLESRVPLLDHRIVELAAGMPTIIKWKGGKPKHVFREAVSNVVPKAIWERKDKRGFPTPISEWFNGPLKGYVHEIMTSKRARERGLYDYSSLGKVSSGQFSRSLWGALCVELWHRQYID